MKKKILEILEEGKKYGYNNEAIANELFNLHIVSVSLPTDEEITDWVCNEFKIDGLDFDENVNTQNGYLPEHFKSFAKWILSNER